MDFFIGLATEYSHIASAMGGFICGAVLMSLVMGRTAARRRAQMMDEPV